MIFSENVYYTVMLSMIVIGFVVFFVLQKVEAGYGVFYTRRWGPAISNRTAWIAMELPAFVGMLAFWLLSPRRADTVPAVCGLIFLIHYFQRTFIFPFLMRGKSRMPLIIMVMGMAFNLVNTYLIGGWLFFVSPAGYYPLSWLWSPQFICGCLVFLGGMAINLHSDHIIRNLRKPGDTRHYIPRGGMFRYVTSANYFGEVTEWVGFAILTWSATGAVFAYWTFANLAPRARRLHGRYVKEFGDEYVRLGRRYIIPGIL